jgi:hypothetical protein
VLGASFFLLRTKEREARTTMEYGLIPMLMTQIAGGAGASTLDRMKPEWTLNVGGKQTGFGMPDPDPASVQIAPGALAAVALAAVVAFLPGGTGKSAPTWKLVLANLAGGGIVYEGVKIAETEIIPRVQGTQPQTAPGMPPGATQGMPAMRAGGGFGLYAMRAANPYSHYQIQQGLGALRAVA